MLSHHDSLRGKGLHLVYVARLFWKGWSFLWTKSAESPYGMEQSGTGVVKRQTDIGGVDEMVTCTLGRRGEGKKHNKNPDCYGLTVTLLLLFLPFLYPATERGACNQMYT